MQPRVLDATRFRKTLENQAEIDTRVLKTRVSHETGSSDPPSFSRHVVEDLIPKNCGPKDSALAQHGPLGPILEAEFSYFPENIKVGFKAKIFRRRLMKNFAWGVDRVRSCDLSVDFNRPCSYFTFNQIFVAEICTFCSKSLK